MAATAPHPHAPRVYHSQAAALDAYRARAAIRAELALVSGQLADEADRRKPLDGARCSLEAQLQALQAECEAVRVRLTQSDAQLAACDERTAALARKRGELWKQLKRTQPARAHMG